MIPSSGASLLDSFTDVLLRSGFDFSWQGQDQSLDESSDANLLSVHSRLFLLRSDLQSTESCLGISFDFVPGIFVLNRGHRLPHPLSSAMGVG